MRADEKKSAVDFLRRRWRTKSRRHSQTTVDRQWQRYRYGACKALGYTRPIPRSRPGEWAYGRVNSATPSASCRQVDRIRPRLSFPAQWEEPVQQQLGHRRPQSAHHRKQCQRAHVDSVGITRCVSHKDQRRAVAACHTGITASAEDCCCHCRQRRTRSQPDSETTQAFAAGGWLRGDGDCYCAARRDGVVPCVRYWSRSLQCKICRSCARRYQCQRGWQNVRHLIACVVGLRPRPRIAAGG